MKSVMKAIQWSLVGALLCTLTIQADGPNVKGRQAKGKTGPCRVLIAVNGTYTGKGLNNLDNAINSAAKLGLEFKKCGYAVEFLSGVEGVQQLTQKTGWKPPLIKEANDGDNLSKGIQSWMDDVASTKAPLAILVLVGHGVQRGKTAYLLGRNDTSAVGGVSVEEMANASAMKGLPLVMVYDACRQQPKQVQLKIVDVKGNKVEVPRILEKEKNELDSLKWETKDKIFSVVKVKPSERQRPTILYSTRKDDVADDKHDLVGNLAKGLRLDQEVRDILQAAHPDLKNASTLSLYHWFYYAISCQLRDRKLEQAHEIVVAKVPLIQPIVAWVGRKAVSPKDQLQIDGLLEMCIPTWGEFQSSLDTQTGLVMTHPLKGVTQDRHRYSAGSLGGDEGFAVNGGRTLVLDVVAGHEGPINKAIFACAINASHRPAKSNVPIYLSNDQYTYRFPYNVVTTIRIPVTPKGNLRLNGYGFGYPPDPRSEWARGSTLTVLDMKLEPRDTIVVPVVSPKITELLSLVRLVNPTNDGNPLLLSLPNTKPRGLSLKPDSKDGKPAYSTCGGQLLHSVFVPKNNKLYLTAYNAGKQPAELSIDLLNVVQNDGKWVKTSFVKPGVIRLSPGLNKLVIPLTSSGFAHYLSLGTRSNSITLNSLKVIPATR